MHRYVRTIQTHLMEASRSDLSFSFPARPFSSISRLPAAVIRYFGIPAITAFGNFDVLHIIDQNLAWYGSLARTRPLVVTIHDIFGFTGEAQGLGKATLPLASAQIRRASQLVAVSAISARSASEFFRIPLSRISIVPNIADPVFRPLLPEHRAAIRQKLLGRHNYLLVQVGSGIPRKNRPLAMKALTVLRRDRKLDALLILVGPGPTHEEQRLLAEESIRGSVMFLQDINDLELAELLGAADAYLCTSTHEGFCVPAIEALAASCPVVCVDAPVFREVLNDAAVFAPATARALAGELALVMTGGHIRAELVERGRRQVSRYSPNAVIPQLLRIYQRVA